MDFYVSFLGTEHWCGWERSEIQKVVNVCINPFLKGYSSRSSTLINKTWRYGKNVVVLKDGTKTSFRVYSGKEKGREY